MKLFEHPDFEQVLLQKTAENFRGRELRLQLIEKDWRKNGPPLSLP